MFSDKVISTYCNSGSAVSKTSNCKNRTVAIVEYPPLYTIINICRRLVVQRYVDGLREVRAGRTMDHCNAVISNWTISLISYTVFRCTAFLLGTACRVIILLVVGRQCESIQMRSVNGWDEKRRCITAANYDTLLLLF